MTKRNCILFSIMLFMVSFKCSAAKVSDVSTQCPEHAAALAIDGNEDSYWLSSKGMSPAWLAVDIGRTTKINGVQLIWGDKAAKSYKIYISSGDRKWEEVACVDDGRKNESRMIFFDDREARMIKVYCEEGADGDEYSINEIKLLCNIEEPYADNPIISIKASSEGPGSDGAITACDGNDLTRWASKQGSESEWIEFEFAAVQKIKAVEIIWERASAKEYTIETSVDGRTWELQAAVKDGRQGERRMVLLKNEPEAKFFRVNCFSRASVWGYSIWEVKPTLTGKPKFPEKRTAKKAGLKFDRFQSQASGALKKEWLYRDASEKLIKGVTASSTREGHEPSYAVDPRMKTSWFSDANGEEWLQVEFKEGVILGNLRVKWNYNPAQHFKVQVSEDGSNWQDVYEQEGVGKYEQKYISFDSVACRFMRILCMKPTFDDATAADYDSYSIIDISINPAKPTPVWKQN
ncbi:MAG: discoidin domain-containing protein [Candidatus Aureabacteria bacterium]|nr:discoidin domain-containing protein [Candidatus Auribacterota bacterium]